MAAACIQHGTQQVTGYSCTPRRLPSASVAPCALAGREAKDRSSHGVLLAAHCPDFSWGTYTVPAPVPVPVPVLHSFNVWRVWRKCFKCELEEVLPANRRTGPLSLTPLAAREQAWRSGGGRAERQAGLAPNKSL